MRRKRCSKMSVTRHRQRDSFIVAGLERRNEISNPRAARRRAFVTGKKSAVPSAAAGGSRGRKSGAGGAGGGIASDAIREAPPRCSERGAVSSPVSAPRRGVIKMMAHGLGHSARQARAKPADWIQKSVMSMESGVYTLHSEPSGVPHGPNATRSQAE